MKIHGTPALTILALTALLLGGCGGGGDESGGTDAEATAVANNPLRAVDGPVTYKSSESRFDVVWPSGCARIHNRATPADDSENPTLFARQRYYCDREGIANEGCAIGVQLLRNLSPAVEPTPELVIESAISIMQAYRVDILRQSPIIRGQLEGIGLHCASVDSSAGTLWIEGFPWDGNIYMLTAWSEDRSIFELEEFRNFFRSFTPWPPDEGDAQ